MHIHHIETKLQLYKIKAIKIKLLKGSIIWVSLFLGLGIFIGVTEWVGELSTLNRTIIFILYSTIILVSAAFLIIRPILQLLNAKQSIKDNDAAAVIGSYFPSIKDKLINFLELSRINNSSKSLAQASINQKAKSLDTVEFTEAVDVSESKKPFKIFIPLLIVLGAILLLAPNEFVSSTNRIINFRTEYTPTAPFSFEITSDLHAYQYEDYQLVVKLTGNSIPSDAYIVDGTAKIKMANTGVGSFTLLLNSIQESKTFHVEAAGFNSSKFELVIISRPTMNSLSANIRYPAYLKLKNEIINPAGELELPEGTLVSWVLNAQHSDDITYYYNADTITAEKISTNDYRINKTIIESGFYGFILNSEIAEQKGKIEYSISAIKDLAPKIHVQSFVDTLLYKSISIGGEIADDHGISRLLLKYQKENQPEKTIKLSIKTGSSQQQIYYNWMVDSLALSPGENISYYLQVFDNDQVNGNKSTKSNTMYLKVPSKEELETRLAENEKAEKSSINKAKNKSAELRKKLDKAVEDLKGKKELSWEDKQNIKELLNEKEKLNEKVEALKKQNELLNLQRSEIQKPSPELEEKAQQLQSLMNELLDEETKKLYEELQKLLEDQAEADKVQSMLNDIQNKEMNLEEELERTLELFKRLQVEQNLEKLTEDLNELAEKQDSLAENTKDKKNSTENLKEKQEEIEKEFEKIKEDLEETKKKNSELKRPESFEETSGEEEEIDKEISDSKENLEKNNRKKSSQNQKGSSENMKKLAKKLEKMQGGMQMEQMQEDINNLRAILENLITLSYTQEQVMIDFRAVNQSNPQFVSLSEQQLKIKDDSKIIKDSLLSLASRVLAISSFVTRELNEMDAQLDKSTDAIKDRKKAQATGYQQLSMTSMNNLALMLDNVLQQMQESMADAMGKGKGEKKQPMPGMSELQEQLNKEIRELQKSGKSGKELSQELAKLAAQQEMIRKALRKAEEKLGNKPGNKEGNKPGNLGNLQKQMEQTELDLVNKNLSRDLQRRQQQILTRLLEAEKALREQEMDLKRESKSAVQYEKELPKAFEEYLKQKQKEIELIKTIPPKLHPYYKKEVNEYFNRLKKTDN